VKFKTEKTVKTLWFITHCVRFVKIKKT